MILSRYIMLVSLTLLAGFCKVSNRSEPSGSEPYSLSVAELEVLASTTEQMNIQLLHVNSGVTHLLPAFSYLYENVFQVPENAFSLCRALVADCRQPEALIYHSFRMLGAPAGGFGPPLAGSEGQQYGGAIRFIEEGENNWQVLPREVRAGIQAYLNAWWQAAKVLEQFRDPLFEQMGKEGMGPGYLSWEQLMAPWKNRQSTDFSCIDLIGRADIRKLSFASRLIASAVSRLMKINPEAIPEAFESCVFETEMGRMALYGSKADTIEASCGMIMDFGGDDHYLGQVASSSPQGQSICVVLDFTGDDSYHSEGSSLAGASLGIGMLFDLSGNDTYISEGAGIASSCYGSSMLFDGQGDDFYLSNSEFSQGAAHLGSALLIDLEGDDEYFSAGMSQGYGGTLGIGLLLDLTGNDRYNERHPASSFVQGAGRGRWAEASDGHSLGGGLGIFIEAGGSDYYSADSFSQGASYFTGIGLFFDLEGDDHYTARSHSQGYAAHYALAGFFEQKGDDQYNNTSDFARITQVLGSGRDLSAGWFIDDEGDDIYHFGNRSGGIGDLNGLGFLWDRRGQDTYVWHQNEVNPGSPSLGQTISLSGGMAIGSRMGTFPEGRNLGQFRDDDQRKLIIKE